MSHQRRVYIVDADSEDRKSIVAHLAAVGAEAWPLESSAEFLAMVDHLAPGCVLLDVGGCLPGLQALEELKRQAIGWPVIALGHDCDLEIAVEAMKRGAADFLCKPLSPLQLAAALAPAWGQLQRSVATDQARRSARERVSRLTTREFDVFLALVVGKANKAAAYQLGISVRTIEMHRARIMAKLGVRSLSEATLLMTRAGMDLSPALPFRTERGGPADLRLLPDNSRALRAAVQ